MQFHPVANIFPMMSAEEFSALKADIREHGLYEPIWLHQGQIIDGRHRYRACRALKIKPEFREWDGEGSLVAFVLSLNLKRRHLNESQRALVGARIKPLFEEEARERQRGGQGGVLLRANLREAKSKSATQAAQAVNVSPRSVESASLVLEQGAPELIAAVEQGRASVPGGLRCLAAFPALLSDLLLRALLRHPRADSPVKLRWRLVLLPRL